MGLSFHCPQCSQAVPALPTQMGQQITCPACQAKFRLSPVLLGGNGQSRQADRPAKTPAAAATAAPPAATAMAPPAPPTAPPIANVVKAPPRSAPPAAISTPPKAPPTAPHPAAASPPAAPQQAPNVARFIAAASQDSTVQLTADGKLPELSLAEATASKPKSSESSTSPLILGLALGASTLISILLVVADFDGGTTSTRTLREARQTIESHYAGQSGTLLPYQVLLRDAQRAYERKDYQQERQCYRRVMELLRSESKDPFAGVTGTKSGDKELMRQLEILLSPEGR